VTNKTKTLVFGVEFNNNIKVMDAFEQHMWAEFHLVFDLINYLFEFLLIGEKKEVNITRPVALQSVEKIFKNLLHNKLWN